MPTYEYTCKDCGTNLEVFQSFTDKPVKKCPQCGGALQKVFHPRGVVFKGSGFYATDSRAKAAASNGEGNGAANGTKPKPAEKKPAASKTDD